MCVYTRTIINNWCGGLCQYICADASGAMPPRLEPPPLATPTAPIRVSNSPPEDSPASGPNAVSSSSSLLLSPALPLASPNLFALSCAFLARIASISAYEWSPK